MNSQRALVIDDDPHLALLFRDALKICGLNAEYITRSLEAMAKIRSMMPDLIVLDLNMPEVSGMDILLAIRGDETLKPIKVVLVTANSVAVRDEQLNALADLILVKPVTITQIVELTSRLLGSA